MDSAWVCCQCYLYNSPVYWTNIVTYFPSIGNVLSVRNLDSATSCFLLCCNCGVASLFLCTGNGTMSRRRISVKELGQPDHQGWLYRKKESKGFLGIKWKKYWFVLKKTSLYWYNNQLVSKAAFYRPIYDVQPESEAFIWDCCHSSSLFTLFLSQDSLTSTWSETLSCSKNTNLLF